MRYRFHVHKRLRNWRLVLAEGAAPPAGCVIEDWAFSRTREHDDTQVDVREQVAARGFSLFQLGGEFADIAQALRALEARARSGFAALLAGAAGGASLGCSSATAGSGTASCVLRAS